MQKQNGNIKQTASWLIILFTFAPVKIRETDTRAAFPHIGKRTTAQRDNEVEN
jgi:hypothetical protein